jgi:hypothetical protein
MPERVNGDADEARLFGETPGSFGDRIWADKKTVRMAEDEVQIRAVVGAVQLAGRFLFGADGA